MKYLIILFLISFVYKMTSANEKKSSFIQLSDYCNEFNGLNTQIRDCKIKQNEALIKFKDLITKIKYQYQKSVLLKTDTNKLVFPLLGYDYHSISKKKGHGYVEGRFNYFDGNKHSGHPAFDMFIRDNNQDNIDDKTKKNVLVLSCSDGVVVSLENKWDNQSSLKGGKYIYIYNPDSNCLYYYAHNNEIFVKLGDTVKASSLIATVGRTGLNAQKKRSTTHLHFMVLKIDNEGFPKPINYFDELVRAGRRN